MAKAPNRSTVVLSAIAGVLLVAVVVVLTIYLLRPSGTTASEAPESPSAPAGSSSSSEPEPAETEAAPSQSAGIAVSATGFTITGADGDTFTHEWADDAQPAVEALTALFGAEPTEDFQNGDAENWAYDIHVWPGFRLYDVRLSGDRDRSEVPAPTYVSYGPGVPVTVSDDFGIEVGMSVDELDALGPDDVIADGGTAAYLFGEDRATFYQDGARTFGAVVSLDTTDSASFRVTHTYAPKL